MTKESWIQHLPMEFVFHGMERVVNPTLMWDEESVLLADAGFPGQSPMLRLEIERAGVPYERVNTIIVTHLDWDHIGGLGDTVESLGHDVEVLAHELEKPYIQGDEIFIKNPQRNAGAGLPTPNFKRTRVTRVVRDGEDLPLAGGVVVIHTPGHTLGHICLYHKGSKTLVSGDALNVIDGELTGPNPQYTHDLPRALASLKKLADYDIHSVICYHGGLFTDNVNRRIAEIASGGA